MPGRCSSGCASTGSRLAHPEVRKGADDFVFTRKDGSTVRDFRTTWGTLASVPGWEPSFARAALSRQSRGSAARSGNCSGCDRDYAIVGRTDVVDAMRTLQRKLQPFTALVLLPGAGRGNRTPMRLPSADFESAASASSAIPARVAKFRKPIEPLALQPARLRCWWGFSATVLNSSPMGGDAS